MLEETKKIAKKPKLYMELEKKYTEEQVREQERERVEKLREIREQYRPINRDDFESHQRKYEQLIRQKKEELNRKRGGLLIQQP